METIQKNIANFIQTQFPAEYRENGPVFIEFVKAYYRWMEGSQPVENVLQFGTISVMAANSVIVGSNTAFTTDTAAGAQIAIYRDADRYDVVTINAIANDTYMTVTDNIQFTNTATTYANTEVQFNPTYYQRRLLEFTDIDNTTDQFMSHFKNQYLTDIQFDINSDIRLLLKHTLDLYRAKGTPQAVELLFRIVFGTDVQIYFPGDDVFKLSDGVWKKPRYIEISLNKYADRFVGLQITGQTSKATAFVEKLVRRKINGRLIDILYVSDVAGTFILGEKLQSHRSGLALTECPIMIGSLTGVDVDSNGVGEEFSVGDLVDIYSDNGGEAVARVSGTTNTSGVINFELVDGGYAYTANSTVYVSNNTLTVNTVTGTYDIYTPCYFDMWETLTQVYANVEYIASNGEFTEGSNVYTYFANGSQKGIAVVLDNNAQDDAVGSIVVAPLSGNIVADAIFSVSNAVGATVNVISGIAWMNASATVLEVSNTINLYTNVTSTFAQTDNIYQLSDIGIVIANGTVTRTANTAGYTRLTVTVNDGKFITGNTVYSNAGGQGNIASVELNINVVGVSSVFFANGMNNITGARSNGTVTQVSFGAGASVAVGTLVFTENVSIANTLINPYTGTALANGTFQFPAMPTGNLTNGTINAQLQFSNVTIGRIGTIVGAKGSDYTSAPTVKIVESWTYPYRKRDCDFVISSGGFLVGEVITQQATGARGLVREETTSGNLHAVRMTWEDANNFILTTNSTTTIIGTTSGSVANITAIGTELPPELGINAVIEGSLVVANGAINAIDVLESGYGFIDGEQVTISGNNQQLMGFANVYTVGTGRGFYLKQGGFLSSRKKIYDGVYYQQYSYDIRSSITLDKYEKMLKQVVHAAGTMLFGTLVHEAEISQPSQFLPATVTTS